MKTGIQAEKAEVEATISTAPASKASKPDMPGKPKNRLLLILTQTEDISSFIDEIKLQYQPRETACVVLRLLRQDSDTIETPHYKVLAELQNMQVRNRIIEKDFRNSGFREFICLPCQLTPPADQIRDVVAAHSINQVIWGDLPKQGKNCANLARFLDRQSASVPVKIIK